MTSKIYSIVKSILNAVISVTIPRLSFYLGNSSSDCRKKYNDLLNRIRNALLLLLFPAVTGLFCLSGDVLQLLGGNEFQSGVTSLRILCIAMVFAVLGCFYAHAVLIVNRQDHIFFKATVISAIINIVLNFIFIPLIGINGAALTTVLSEIAIVLICAFPANRFFQNDQSKILQYLIPTLIECVVILIVSTLMMRLVQQRILRLVFTILFSLIIYFIILFAAKNELLMDTVQKFQNKFNIKNY